jgi:hypothetical protein
VRFEPLYTLAFRYDESSTVRRGDDVDQLLAGRGRCEGRLSGGFRGTNRARRRRGQPFEPDYHGVIETDDGATILWDLSGYGWPEAGRVLATIKHVTADAAYAYLNEALCVAKGEVRQREVTLEVAELVWEPIR